MELVTEEVYVSTKKIMSAADDIILRNRSDLLDFRMIGSRVIVLCI